MTLVDMLEVIRKGFGAGHIGHADQQDDAVALTYVAESPAGEKRVFTARISSTQPVRENIRAIEDARRMAKDWADGVHPGGLERGFGG